jgi:hypothetical protein
VNARSAPLLTELSIGFPTEFPTEFPTLGGVFGHPPPAASVAPKSARVGHGSAPIVRQSIPSLDRPATSIGGVPQRGWF